MYLLQVTGISKRQDGSLVVDDISFTQRRFQKIAVAGETGSGKSTLLRIIAGLVQPDTGTILFENRRVEGPMEKLIPGHPRIAYLSQQFELRNNYRVEEVLDYATSIPAHQAAGIFEICRISHLLKRRTDQVSGGEKQRIALARLLISAPALLLLDEPYSNLDMIHKNILKSVIKDIGENLVITCMLISHDPLDTLSWADELFVLQHGKIIQQGTPTQVYRHPVNEYAAALFGTYSLLPPGLQTSAGNNLHFFCRPEDFQIVQEHNGAIAGTVTQVVFMGSYWHVEVRFDQDVITVRTATGSFEKGEQVFVALRKWS